MTILTPAMRVPTKHLLPKPTGVVPATHVYPDGSRRESWGRWVHPNNYQVWFIPAYRTPSDIRGLLYEDE